MGLESSCRAEGKVPLGTAGKGAGATCVPAAFAELDDEEIVSQFQNRNR